MSAPDPHKGPAKRQSSSSLSSAVSLSSGFRSSSTATLNGKVLKTRLSCRLDTEEDLAAIGNSSSHDTVDGGADADPSDRQALIANITDRQKSAYLLDEEKVPLREHLDHTADVTGKSKSGQTFRFPPAPSVDGTAPAKRQSWRTRLATANVGLPLMVVNTFLASASGMAVKLLSHSPVPYPTFELVFVRSVIMAVTCILAQKLYFRQNNILLGPPGTRMLVMARSVTGFISTGAYYLCIRHLGVGEATVISFTGPLFVGILGLVVLRERWEPVDAGCAFISLGGVAIIARPSLLDFLLHEPHKAQTIIRAVRDMAAGTSVMHMMALGMGVLSAFVGAMALICLRKIGSRVGLLQILTTFSLVSAVLSVPSSLVLNGTANVLSVLPSSVSEGLLLFGAVPVTSLMGQLCVSRALQCETAAKCSSMNFLQIVFSFLLEYLIVHKVPHLSDYVGGGIIVACVLIVSAAKLRKAHKDNVKLAGQTDNRA
ncbi:hypothetical protein RI367_007614 [Sorochytrium milnesiophthora]